MVRFIRVETSEIKRKRNKIKVGRRSRLRFLSRFFFFLVLFSFRSKARIFFRNSEKPSKKWNGTETPFSLASKAHSLDYVTYTRVDENVVAQLRSGIIRRLTDSSHGR